MAVTGENVVGLCWFTVALTFILICLRAYVRFFHVMTRPTRKLTFLSESLMFLAWGVTVGLVVINTKLKNLGAFESDDTTNLGIEENVLYTEPVLRLFYITWFLYFTPMYAVKNVMMIFYYTTVIPPSFRKTYICFRILWVWLVISWVSNILLSLFWCLPPSRSWDLSHPKGFCTPSGIYFKVFTYLPHFSTDFFVYTLPIPVLIRLQLTKQQKISAAVSFLLGLLSMIFATLQAISYENPGLNSLANNFVFATMEATWALLVPCVPAFKVFFRTQQQAIRNMRPRDEASSSVSSGDVASSEPSEGKEKDAVALSCTTDQNVRGENVPV